jgi:hypothetical protein
MPPPAPDMEEDFSPGSALLPARRETESRGDTQEVLPVPWQPVAGPEGLIHTTEAGSRLWEQASGFHLHT